MRNLHLDPVFRSLEHLCQLGLSGPGLRTVHVLPLGTERQGHQNTLIPTTELSVTLNIFTTMHVHLFMTLFHHLAPGVCRPNLVPLS